MRLDILRTGHRPLQKLQMFFIKRMMGFLPGPIAVLSYRRSFFGKYFEVWLQQALRKAKHWSVGEIELIGAFVSSKNACQYCTSDHRAVAKMALDVTVIDAVLEDYRSAPIDERMKVTLAFLERLSQSPAALSVADLEPLRQAGLNDEAIEEAMHICAVFCTINRLADAFDFEMAPDPEKVGRFLYKNGYGMSSLRG